MNKSSMLENRDKEKPRGGDALEKGFSAKMGNIRKERSYKSYFLEKDEFVEQSILNEFSYLLTASLSNVDLRKERRLFTIIHILAFTISSITVIPLLVYTTFLLRDKIIDFTTSLHYTLIASLAITFIINLNIRAAEANALHSSHAIKFFHYDEPGRVLGVRSLENKMAKEKRLLVLMPVAICLIGAILFTAILIDNYLGVRNEIYHNGVNMKLLAPLYVPFESYESSVGFILANALIINQLGITAVCLASTVYFYAVAFQRIILQFQVLRLSISQIDKRANDLHVEQFGEKTQDEHSKQFEACLISCLKHNIEHYNVMRRHVDALDVILKGVLLVTFMIGSIIIGLSVVLITKESLTVGNKLATGAMCAAEIANIFLSCFYGERLTTETIEILVELYSVRWYNYTPKFQRLLLQFREVAGTPLVLTGGGLMKVCLETFSTIMNTAYSYYQFLSAA